MQQGPIICSFHTPLLPSESLFIAPGFLIPPANRFFPFPSLFYSGLISWNDSIQVKSTVKCPKVFPSIQPISISQRWAIHLKGVVVFITVNLRNEDALRI